MESSFSRMSGDAFGVWLLRRHAELLQHADARIRRMLVAPDESPDAAELRWTIMRAVGNDNVLESARTWWASVAPSVTATTEFHRLHALLRYLDGVYSRRTTRLSRPIDNSILVTGARWWNLRQAVVEKGIGALDGPPFRSMYHFPHIRLVDADSVVTEYYRDTFRDVWTTHEMRVGLCALSGAAQTAFTPTTVMDGKRSTYGFRGSGIRTEADEGTPGSHYLQELRDAVEWARKERVHILCFPELSVCADGRQELEQMLRDNAGTLGLIVGGSFHVERRGHYVNSAPYWVVSSSRGVQLLHEYEKIEPFSTRVKGAEGLPQMKSCCDAAKKDECRHLIEDITPGGTVHVVDTALGVFGIVICRDYLSGPRFVEQYARLVDHLLVVSMNASENAWFWESSEDPLRANAVGSFYVNATQIVRDAANTTVDIVFCNTPRDKTRVFRGDTTGSAAMPKDGRFLKKFTVPAELLQ